MISAVVITYNEERNILTCLSSLVPLVDEIIVVDSGSTDLTVKLAGITGAKIYTRPFDNYILQKNYANTLASGDYILSLDADEYLSVELLQTLAGLIHNGLTADAYSMNRRNLYRGKWIKHGGWYPDRKIRLWKKGMAQWGGPQPHEDLMLAPGATTVHLEGDILHNAYETLKSHKEKSAKYARMKSARLKAEGKKLHFLKGMIKSIAKFIKMYVLQGGWRDGANGWHIARISAWETYWAYTG